MRRLLILLLMFAAILGAVYAVSPFLAAWDVHAAIKSGDRDMLERRVDWPAVRESLKRSAAESRQVLVEIAEASGEGNSGLWQRLKNAATGRVVDPLIDRYATPENAPRVYQWGQTWRDKVRPRLGLEEPPTALHGTWLAGTAVDKAWTVWRRVEHVRFEAPTRLSLEVRDRRDERRRWRAALTLVDWSWRLTSLEVART